MHEIICNTSPLQYLYQIGKLEILPRLAKSVIVPKAVVTELANGIICGIDLPDITQLDWCTIRTPQSVPVLPLVSGLGAGEIAVLALAIESNDAIAVLDDAQARFRSERLKIPITGTIGLLLDAKRSGIS